MPQSPGGLTCLEGIKAETMGVLLGRQQVDGCVVHPNTLHASPSAIPRPTSSRIVASQGCSQRSAHSLSLPPAHLLQQPDPCKQKIQSSAATLCIRHNDDIKSTCMLLDSAGARCSTSPMSKRSKLNSSSSSSSSSRLSEIICTEQKHAQAETLHLAGASEQALPQKWWLAQGFGEQDKQSHSLRGGLTALHRSSR